MKELPEKWNDIKKQEIVKKQQVAPLQVNEFINIRKKLSSFDATLITFRKAFLKMRTYFYDCENPYELLDKVKSIVSYLL